MGGWLGGWLEKSILMKIQSSNLDLDFELGFVKRYQGVAVARDVINYACNKNVNLACVTLDMKNGFDLLQMSRKVWILKQVDR